MFALVAFLLCTFAVCGGQEQPRSRGVATLAPGGRRAVPALRNGVAVPLLVLPVDASVLPLSTLFTQPEYDVTPKRRKLILNPEEENQDLSSQRPKKKLRVEVRKGYQEASHERPYGDRPPARYELRSRRVPFWEAPVAYYKLDEDYSEEDESYEVAIVRRRPRPATRSSSRDWPRAAPRPPPPPPLEYDFYDAEPAASDVVSSRQLIKDFRAQKPTGPDLPPMVLPESDRYQRGPIPIIYKIENSSPRAAPGRSAKSNKTSSGSPRSANYSTSPTSISDRDPPRPQFDKLPFMRVRLTVPRADYTEPYAVWFDEATGAARIDFHGGSTSTVRSIQPDGRVQKLEVRLDRSGGSSLRRCALASGRPAGAADRAHPALPDLNKFSFGTYEEAGGRRVEVWRRAVLVRARSETASAHHELRLLRTGPALAVPLRYTVTVDSSLLGPNCDGYEHVYEQEEVPPFDAELFKVNRGVVCHTEEALSAAEPEQLARLEPLREFFLPYRDPRYDDIFEKFQEQHERRYVDEAEEAVRKNLLVQTLRFIASANRQGSTAKLGPNFLSDRLDREVDQLKGYKPASEDEGEPPGSSFPLSGDELKDLGASLPTEFSWRDKGGVTPVRFQGECMSCWAHAVVGAVEGAAFIASKLTRLTQLSEQSVVDCSDDGTRGCSPSWPSSAYKYAIAHGLPKAEEYTAYKAEKDKCTDYTAETVTRIQSYADIPSMNLLAIQAAILKHAPVVVIVDTDCPGFKSIEDGVVNDDRCGKKKTDIDHAVLAVGWKQRENKTYLILKNSWSDKWGDKGYANIDATSNSCGVLMRPSYPMLAETVKNNSTATTKTR